MLQLVFLGTAHSNQEDRVNRCIDSMSARFTASMGSDPSQFINICKLPRFPGLSTLNARRLADSLTNQED
jgi:hypothetical protein